VGFEQATIIAIARLGGYQGFVTVPSRQLGQVLGRSQQSASRYLIDLERDGLVEREMVGRVQRIRLTAAGRGRLRALHQELEGIITRKPGTAVIKGRITSGMGEGAYYLSRKGYREGLAALVGFTPYPGTLNVVPNEPFRMDMLSGKASNMLPGYSGEERSFGAVRVFRASLRDIPCAVVMPERTHRTDVLEIIAADRLRDVLGIDDGEEIEVTVHLR